MPAWFTRELHFGDTGDDVLIVQRKVDAPLTGIYDEDTYARVRGVQRSNGMDELGYMDQATADVLGEKATAGLMPDWHGTPEEDGRVREILRLSNIEPLEDGIRRFQSAHGLPLTGAVDDPTATALADLSY